MRFERVSPRTRGSQTASKTRHFFATWTFKLQLISACEVSSSSHVFADQSRSSFPPENKRSSGVDKVKLLKNWRSQENRGSSQPHATESRLTDSWKNRRVQLLDSRDETRPARTGSFDLDPESVLDRRRFAVFVNIVGFPRSVQQPRGSHRGGLVDTGWSMSNEIPSTRIATACRLSRARDPGNSFVYGEARATGFRWGDDAFMPADALTKKLSRDFMSLYSAVKIDSPSLELLLFLLCQISMGNFLSKISISKLNSWEKPRLIKFRLRKY